MAILNIAGYKFISLENLAKLRLALLEQGEKLSLKGTILLSTEGVNISLAGQVENIKAFKNFCFKVEPCLSDILFRESYSENYPFKRFKVKIKNEIITMKRAEIQPEKKPAPNITPDELKKWLDEQRDFTLLDTRNDYEVEIGTFKKALALNISDFCEFPNTVLEKVNPDKPVVMFCTGGIRCEKAAIYLKNSGFAEVYQLEGGILNYFAKIGGDHYNGDCFVFDQRIAVDNNLQEKKKETVWD